MIVLGASLSEALRDVVPKRAEHADRVHADMPEEAAVLGGEQGVAELLGDFLVGHQLAPVLGFELAEHLTLVVVQDHLQAGLVFFQHAHLGGVGHVDHGDAHAGAREDHEEKGEDQVARAANAGSGGSDGAADATGRGLFRGRRGRRRVLALGWCQRMLDGLLGRARSRRGGSLGLRLRPRLARRQRVLDGLLAGALFRPRGHLEP